MEIGPGDVDTKGKIINAGILAKLRADAQAALDRDFGRHTFGSIEISFFTALVVRGNIIVCDLLSTVGSFNYFPHDRTLVPKKFPLH